MHQSLYRAYRPSSFKEVVGQEHITDSLAEQIAGKKIGHAYLFAGSRGLGKTSIARIFAHELGTSERDIYEIDAASNNSVDDIRALTENVYTLPFESAYKVYILDEAHMLSKGAWNAFLKTLEEPPAHVIFILATTELSKVPETVQSRCQVYEFRKPTRSVLAKLIADIAKKEGRAIEPAAADLVAMLGDGSYRDALSVLENVFAAAGKTVTRAEAEQATGAPKRELVEALVEALSAGDADKALAAIRKTEQQSVDMTLYLSLVLEQVRTILLVRYAAELRKEIADELGPDAYASVEKIAAAKDSKLSHRTLKVLLDATERMRFSPVPSLPLELAVFELLGQDGEA
ncbi:MAG: DNA polymerase III subunit gamma/tau [Candidatus Pacebacteria bacterium]|nr:DNA polymerase III subunit gamma/tau [Candidatus Paceibacterota bacterium]